MSNSTVVADTFTSSMSTSTSDVRKDTLGSNLILAAASATKYASMPHICPVDIHTPDPTNKSAACPATISERIGVSLSTCMIRVFYTVLSEVYAREAYLLFQAHTMSTWSALWHEDEGASVLAFLRDAPDEVKAVEYTVRDVMLVFETRAFQERVAHIALEVATERFLQGITEAVSHAVVRPQVNETGTHISHTFRNSPIVQRSSSTNFGQHSAVSLPTRCSPWSSHRCSGRLRPAEDFGRRRSP